MRKMMMKMKRRTHRRMTKIATLMGLVSSKNSMKRKMRRTTMKMKSRKHRKMTLIAALMGLVRNWTWMN